MYKNPSNNTEEIKGGNQEETARVRYGAWVLHCPHVVLWKKRNFQDFGVGKYCFMAGGGNGLPSDSMNLVESMGSQQAVVCSPNEQL